MTAIVSGGVTRGVTGRGWAYVGTVLGASVSVLANIAHSYTPPVCAPVSAGGTRERCVPWTPPADWAPPTEAVIGSALWPVLVVVAVEILTRVDWPPSSRWLAARWLGLLPVALVAAIVSYQHLHGLLLHWGEGELAAALGPLAPDGLMVIAATALLIPRPCTVTPSVAVAVPASVPVAVSVATPPRPVPVLAVPALDTLPDTAPDMVPEHTPAPVSEHARASATAARTVTPRTVSEHVPAPDTDTDDDLGALIHAIAGTTDTQLADTLRASGTSTLRGAMKELGVGQTRARRVLALAWPTDATLNLAEEA